MIPLRVPGAGQDAENVEKILGKPEQGKSESGSADWLSHEHDQHLKEQCFAPRSDAEQATHDIESGQLDTDLHNTLGVERVVHECQAVNHDNSGHRIASHSADGPIHKRGQTDDPSHSRDEYEG